jgi:hypothetical protein
MSLDPSTLAVWAFASNSRDLAGGLGFKGSFLLLFFKKAALQESRVLAARMPLRPLKR